MPMRPTSGQSKKNSVYNSKIDKGSHKEEASYLDDVPDMLDKTLYREGQNPILQGNSIRLRPKSSVQQVNIKQNLIAENKSQAMINAQSALNHSQVHLRSGQPNQKLRQQYPFKQQSINVNVSFSSMTNKGNQNAHTIQNKQYDSMQLRELANTLCHRQSLQEVSRYNKFNQYQA